MAAQLSGDQRREITPGSALWLARYSRTQVLRRLYPRWLCGVLSVAC